MALVPPTPAGARTAPSTCAIEPRRQDQLSEPPCHRLPRADQNPRYPVPETKLKPPPGNGTTGQSTAPGQDGRFEPKEKSARRQKGCN